MSRNKKIFNICWMKEKWRKCRLFEDGREIKDHVSRECQELKEIKDLLSEDESGFD